VDVDERNTMDEDLIEIAIMSRTMAALPVWWTSLPPNITAVRTVPVVMNSTSSRTRA
jgi:hypothetical protein